MSTHCRIRMELPTGESKAIYCHQNGYPSYQVPMLKKYYNNTEKVRELLNLGSISYLAPRVKPDPDEKHSFNEPIRDVVVAYHRDRGEPLKMGCDLETYNYMWDGKNWHIEDGQGKIKV